MGVGEGFDSKANGYNKLDQAILLRVDRDDLQIYLYLIRQWLLRVDRDDLQIYWCK